MSTKRRLTSTDAIPSKKGPHGGRQCRWCGDEVFPPNKTYCGPPCVHEWRLRSDVAYLRSQLFLRDKGICRDCGLDTVKLRVELYALTPEDRERRGAEHGIDPYHARNLMLWEADHTVPVYQGGGVELGNNRKAGLDSLTTRCIRCHRAKSQQDVLRERL